MKKERIERLLVKHPSGYKKIRRILFNLYRPIIHPDKNKKFFMFKLHPITYIMVIAFITSFILHSKGNENWALPFIGCWIFIPVTWIYFKFQPQTWEEMEDYEKVVFRGINGKPFDWEPKL